MYSYVSIDTLLVIQWHGTIALAFKIFIIWLGFYPLGVQDFSGLGGHWWWKVFNLLANWKYDNMPTLLSRSIFILRAIAFSNNSDWTDEGNCTAIAHEQSQHNFGLSYTAWCVRWNRLLNSGCYIVPCRWMLLYIDANCQIPVSPTLTVHTVIRSVYVPATA